MSARSTAGRAGGKTTVSRQLSAHSHLLSILLLVSACTLDPQSVLKKASLRVHVDSLVEGGATLTLTALDSSGRQLLKKSNVSGRTEVDVLFEEGVVLDGDVEL